MFTKNFYTTLAALCGDIPNTSVTASLLDSAGNSATVTVDRLDSSIRGIGGLGLANTNTSYKGILYGSMYYLSNGTTIYAGSGTYSGGSTVSAAYSGVILGDGDTTPTVDDVDISGNLITDISATTAVSVNLASDNIKIIATYNITNTGVSDITIKEYALRMQNQGVSAYCIFNRGLLSQPVTIAPGDSAIISIEIGFQN